jgi:hypothetical protein
VHVQLWVRVHGISLQVTHAPHRQQTALILMKPQTDTTLNLTSHTQTLLVLTLHNNLPRSFIGRTPDSGPFSLGRVKNVVNIFHRLDSRTKCSYAEFTSALDMRAIKYGKVSYTASHLYFITFKAVWKLSSTSLLWRMFYE